jgi:hypothetical protein
MADLKVVKLTDGTEADFPIGTSLADIDKQLAADGLKRDPSVNHLQSVVLLIRQWLRLTFL